MRLCDSQLGLEQLISENLGALYRYSLRLSRGSPDLAEDRLLESVERAARFQDASPTPGADRAWLFGVLTEVYRERGGDTLPSPAAPVGTASACDEYLGGIVQVMDGTDLETRAAWWLGSVEGLSERELAEVLSIPQTIVESRLERAHAILGNKLHELAGSTCAWAGYAEDDDRPFGSAA